MQHFNSVEKIFLFIVYPQYFTCVRVGVYRIVVVYIPEIEYRIFLGSCFITEKTYRLFGVVKYINPIYYYGIAQCFLGFIPKLTYRQACFLYLRYINFILTNGSVYFLAKNINAPCYRQQ